jgi:two-component system, chemotaxis family, sensor kinase CheA
VSDNESSHVPFAEFIDDYFAECDEHLAVARRALLDLEAYVGKPDVDPSLLEELFRSFHSTKGLSAMVGVGAAEQLAHHMESYLSALRKPHERLTMDGLETLISGVKSLEQVIAAHRAQIPPPELEPLLTKLRSLVGTKSAPAVTPGPAPASADSAVVELSVEKQRSVERALQAGARAWRIVFVPVPALAERGVNVNAIRKRLQEFGELMQAVPLILPGGQIAFAFIVTSTADETVLASWREDGITYSPYALTTAAEPVVRNGAEPASPVTGAAVPLIPSNVVRVELARLDDLMRMVGELVISRARLDDNIRRVGSGVAATDLRALQETNQAIERQLRDLREGVMRVRLVPIREVFARMQFVVRDLNREHGKKINLALSGQETEIDKLVIERMMDPLLHLVRNAVSHGLETPAERVAAGKPPEGKISLRAGTTGETIVIEVEDDGRGINEEAVLDRARSAGWLDARVTGEAANLLEIICAPGFSTRNEADRASGRGVGMAVVRTVVEELGGSLGLESQLGQGTRFTIQLPLTLAIADALIVAVGGQKFAVPQVAVREVLQVETSALRLLENNELLPYRAGVLSLVRLATFFHLAEPGGSAFHVLVVDTGAGMVGITVERVLGLREIVVRPLTDPLIQVPGIAGATELGDGHPVLILNTTDLARAIRRPGHGERLKHTRLAAPRLLAVPQAQCRSN